jgi:hypothetical protein
MQLARLLVTGWLLGVPWVAIAQPLDDLWRVRPAVSVRASSASPDPNSNADNRWVRPGDTLTLAEIQGPGFIRHIWMTFPDSAPSWIAKEGSAGPGELVLRMYWDGAAEPAVESPVGDFFACGFGGRAEVNSAPVQVQGGDSYNCFWPMPFHKSARVTITNESTRPLAAFYYQVDCTQEQPPPDAAYFCAQYRQEFPTRTRRDYLIADIESDGGGQYVGTVMSVRSRSPEWFGEGDDKFYVDGEAKPSLWGTGTEDYFLNAWGMERSSFPYFGVTRVDGWLADLGQKGTMYRWHIPDPVRFTRSLRVEIEHAGWMSADETTTGKVEGFVEREDDFATVAFWYQRGQPKRFTKLPSASERVLPLIDDVIEGKRLRTAARAEGGEMGLQAGAAWTGDGQLFFDGTGIGSWVEFSFDVPIGGKARPVLAVTHSYDFGVYAVALDGVRVGDPIDFYSPEVRVEDHSLGSASLSPGTHTIRLECTGINPNSKGYKLGVDSVRLRKRWETKRAPLSPTRAR